MPVIRRDQDMGMIAANPAQNSLDLKIWGLIGTQEIVDSLREVPNQEELKDYPLEKIEAVIAQLKKGWGEVDRYLLDGGVVSSTGTVRFFAEFKDDANFELAKRGFLHTRAHSFSLRSIFEGDYPFKKGNSISIAAPKLGEKLVVVRAPQGMVRKSFA